SREGIVPRDVSDAEIVERCMLALINEGALVLGEGIAQRGSDINVVYVNGYGFPRWRGGPFHYADALGLNQIVSRIEALADQHGSRWWHVAPLLRELAEVDRSLSDYSSAISQSN
ncbi:MAG: 3-hydroxyacyl-CoA dehydrogenase family protein, partial [Maricaulis sp.]|nr:3-hydroxyacyl-CoA dehydrogenase family protein [Maricaulis sp.]